MMRRLYEGGNDGMNATVKLADSSLVVGFSIHFSDEEQRRRRFPEPDGAADVLARGKQARLAASGKTRGEKLPGPGRKKSLSW